MGVTIEAENLKPRHPGWNCDNCNIPNSLAMKYFRERGAPQNIDLTRDSLVRAYCSPKKISEGFTRIMLRVERKFAVTGSSLLENETEADNFSVDISSRCPTKIRTLPKKSHFSSLSNL